MPDESGRAEASTAAALEIRSLRKEFGSAVALDGISLAVPYGSIFGFLGPNGAGKTTAIRIITGLAHPTAGTVRVLGRDLPREQAAIAREIGFLPDVPGFYEWMTAAEFLGFTGRLFGLGGSALRQRVDDLLDLAGLTSVATRIGGFSRGMKQRLGIAQALMNAPRLLILDEPTSALDPIGRREVLETVASLRGRATVFFSTHILADVERVCDTVAILDHGRVVANSSVTALKARAGVHRVAVTIDGDARVLAQRLEGAPWLVACDVVDATLHLTVSDASQAARDLPRAVADASLGLLRLAHEEVSLEDVFVQLVGGERA